jgi:hypothetical protein
VNYADFLFGLSIGAGLVVAVVMYYESDRSPVYDDIHDERMRQNKQWGGPNHDDGHVPEDWLQFIEHQLDRACDIVDINYYPKHEEDAVAGAFRKRMVKIAALAVACVESHDRYTKRDGA